VDVQAKAQNLEQERANAKDEDRKQEKGKAEESEEEKSKTKDEEQKRLEQAVLDGLGAVADNEEVCAAQQEWLAHPVLRVPEIVLYCQEQDTGVPWKRRMAALRYASLPHGCLCLSGWGSHSLSGSGSHSLAKQ
jgi:hypothetical protein